MFWLLILICLALLAGPLRKPLFGGQRWTFTVLGLIAAVAFFFLGVYLSACCPGLVFLPFVLAISGFFACGSAAAKWWKENQPPKD